MKKCIRYNNFFPAYIDAKSSSSGLFIYYNRVEYVIILNLCTVTIPWSTMLNKTQIIMYVANVLKYGITVNLIIVRWLNIYL